MKNLEEFSLELKNDILAEIGEDKNWDTATYGMKFYFSGGGEGGLIILKKNDQEIKRISQKRFGYFFDVLKNLIDPTKTNKGTLTIYPNGEYESSFIWDEVAHLGRLGQGVETWLSSVYQYACERIQDRCSQLSIDIPNEVEMSVSFDKLGVSQPAVFSTKDVPQMNFKLHLEQIYGYYERPYEEEFAEYDAIREPMENDPWDCQIYYQMTNEGELKGYYPRWNKLIFSLNPNDQYSFSDEKLKFEWVEENA